MMPMLKHYGVGTVPWGPIAAGCESCPTMHSVPSKADGSVLCRPYKDMDSTTRGAGRVKDGRGEFPSDKKIIDTVESIAKKRGVSMAEIAVAWSLGSQWVTAPIVGIRSTERLDELLKGLELKLTEEERKSIEESYEPLKVRGHV